MRILIAGLVLITLFFGADPSFAEKICLKDNYGIGGYWELVGGKIDKKIYTAKRIYGNCIAGGYAVVTIENSGKLRITLQNFLDLGTLSCSTVLFSALTDANFNGSGSYDEFGDGGIEGNFTIARISCNSLP